MILYVILWFLCGILTVPIFLRDINEERISSAGVLFSLFLIVFGGISLITGILICIENMISAKNIKNPFYKGEK